MSRIARKPLAIASGVEVKLAENNEVRIKGPKGEFVRPIHPAVNVTLEGSELYVVPNEKHDKSKSMVGTVRVLLANMVHGVSQGFEKKLQLVGVGYRAQLKGKQLELSLGFSHPVLFPVPEGITIEVPSNTEIVVKGADKEQVGQIASEIRAFRPPEPYKGKGVRYVDERIVRKEAKKK